MKLILFLLISSAILGPKGALVLVMSVYAAMLIAGIYTAILAIIVVGIIVIVLEIGDIKNKINVLKI